MARGQAQAADKQLGTTNAAAAGYGANAAPIGANLNTQANNLINSPGYDPATLAAITNAGMGSVNATYGSAKDAIARKSATSGNPASLGALEDSLARDNATAAGNEAGNIQIQNAAFKAQQQAQGQQILSSLYGTDVGAQTSLYGMGPSTLQARAAGPGWAQGFSSVLNSITGAGAAAAKAAGGKG